MGQYRCVPITETVKRVEAGEIGATIPREALATAQTPQGFPFAALLDAHRARRKPAATI